MQHVGGQCGASPAPRGRGQPRLMNNAVRQRAAGWGVAGAPLAQEPGSGGRGSDGRKMAALKEDRSYGLSCGRVSDGSKVSVFHVKLTDSALRAFESYRASQVSVGLGAGVGAQVGLARPTPRRPGLGVRGPASEVLLAGFWASGPRGGRMSHSESGEPRLGRRPWLAAEGGRRARTRAPDPGGVFVGTWRRPGPFRTHPAPGQELVFSPDQGSGWR